MEQINEGVTESKRTISDEWIKNNVYDALETIENYERMMKSGCSELKEYILMMGMQNRIVEIQVKNMELMINEFQILIENVKKILEKTKYEIVKKQIDTYEKYFTKGIELKGKIYKPYKLIRNEGTREVRIILTKTFDSLCSDLCKLRSRMVGLLSHLLWVDNKKDENREEE